MKRFITVAKEHGGVLLVILGTEAAREMGKRAGGDAYQWLKQQLNNKNIDHNDQNARHHSDLPNQGGYISMYIENGAWMKQNH